MKQHNFLRNLLLSLLLLTLCIGGSELAFCRSADPELYTEVTGPFVSFSKTVAGELSGFFSSVSKTASSAAASISGAASSAAGAVSSAVSNAFQSLASIFSRSETAQSSTEPTMETETVSRAATELDTSTGKEILTGGSVPLEYYNQKDEAWACQLFGSDNIGSYGCGPTALAMTVSSMTDYDINPAEMASWCASQGYCAPGDGSYLSIVQGTSVYFGLKCESLGALSPEQLIEKLRSGGVMVALMGQGHFTMGGHFILLHGVTEEGKILVADPNSRDNSLALWDASTIINELSASTDSGAPLWHITS